MNDPYDLSCQFFTSDIFEAIHVTGDNSTSNSDGSLYEKALGTPNNGHESAFCKGKHILMIFTIAKLYSEYLCE